VKTTIKRKSLFSDQEITFTVDEKLALLKDKVLAPRKLEDANKILKHLKTPLPKV